MNDLGPYMENMIVVGDCLDVMASMPDGCCDLVFADPPYNKGKADWDKGHDWHTWVAEAVRVLKPNGALWAIHDDPLELAAIGRAIRDLGLPFVNWITWDKFDYAYVRKYKEAGSRSFINANEYLIYHADERQWTSQRDSAGKFIFEPLWNYFEQERLRARLSIKQVEAMCGTIDMASRHYVGKRAKTQWQLPTRERYLKMQKGFNYNGGDEYLCHEYEDLRREYEDRRREYEYLRYTFHNPNRMSSIWQGPPSKCGWHPTSKPEWLLERIIRVTSNEGDLVADFFMGSGTTAVAADRLGRNFFGCDANPIYVEMALKQLENDRAERAQLEMAI